MTYLDKLKEMVRTCELMNQNGLNFSHEIWNDIDSLYSKMKQE